MEVIKLDDIKKLQNKDSIQRAILDMITRGQLKVIEIDNCDHNESEEW